MSNARQPRWRLLLTLTIFTLGLQGWAQQQALEPWDVLGDYSCVAAGSDLPAEKLFLLPDMSWDRVAPFAFAPFRFGWISVQARGWRGRLPYAFKPNGVFRVRSGAVELYNTELVEAPDVWSIGQQRNGLLRGLVKLDRPSALPAPPQTGVWATQLVQSFRFDWNSQELTEVLPLDTWRPPLRCQRRPLFTGTLW